MDEWIHKKAIYTYDGILFSLKKEILTHATRINLADIMVTDISQSQKDKHCMIPLTWGI